MSRSVLSPADDSTAGNLHLLQGGILRGDIVVSERLIGMRSVTVEVFAQGIEVAREEVPGPFAVAGETVPFSVAVSRFPRVDLPCLLMGRIVETDEVLDSRIEIADLDELWGRMMPFRVLLDVFTSREIRLRVVGDLPEDTREVFELYDGGTLLGIAQHAGEAEPGGQVFVFDLPDTLLSGAKHMLTIRHRASDLPVTARPLFMRLDLGLEARVAESDVLERIDRLEARMARAYADAFHGLGMDLYRHLDASIQVQRGNFEREISSLRSLLGIGGSERETGPEAPTEVMLDFGDKLLGYGLGPVRTTSAGKQFREVAALSGVLLPGLAVLDRSLRIQGLRRTHPGAVDGAELFVNGEIVPAVVYCSQTSESWNLTAQVPGRLLRAEGNLLELRLPAGPKKGPVSSDPAMPVAGILHVELKSATEMVGN